MNIEKITKTKSAKKALKELKKSNWLTDGITFYVDGNEWAWMRVGGRIELVPGRRIKI